MPVFDLDPFVRAVERFANDLGNVGWGFLVLALGLSLALQLCRAHAWSNSLRAAYPDSGFREREVTAAFLIGAGLNGVLPAKGGEAIKIVLAKRSVPGSSYPASTHTCTEAEAHIMKRPPGPVRSRQDSMAS